MNEKQLNEYLNGPSAMILSGIAMLVTVVATIHSGDMPPLYTGHGVFFNLFQGSGASVWFNVANAVAVVGVVVLLVLLNKVFNFIRDLTYSFGTAYFLLTIANPLSACSFNIGTFMALLFLAGTFIMFFAYENQKSQNIVFLTFAALSFGTMFQWAFAFLIPAFLLGFCYVRAMNFKSFLAMLLGLVVPYWIVLGLGLVTFSDFKPLEINTLWTSFQLSQTRLMVVCVAIVALTTIILSITNLVSIYAYRLQLRVYNAYFIFVSAIVLIAMCVVFRDMMLFLPLLNVCLAIQVGHAFSISKSQKRYIPMILMIVLCITSCISIIIL